MIEKMKYAEIPHVDKKVSRILFGTAMQPFLAGGDGQALLDAMAWIFSQPVNTFAVVSTSKPERMQENIGALHIALGKEELEYLNLEKETL